MNTITDNEIYVYGSNKLGINGSGTALFAKRFFDAKDGIGEGLNGRAYALPTKLTPDNTMSYDELKIHINIFKEFAESHMDLSFILARPGVGRAGFTIDQILPLVSDLPINVQLPGIWLNMLDKKTERIIVAGSRMFRNKAFIYNKLNLLTCRIPDRENRLEVVSGLAHGPDQIGLEWAIENNICYRTFPADWDRFGKQAGYMRNEMMGLYSTRAIIFWDEKSSGTKNMIDICDREKINKRIIRIKT